MSLTLPLESGKALKGTFSVEKKLDRGRWRAHGAGRFQAVRRRIGHRLFTLVREAR